MNRISINTQIPNFMKICPVGAEMFHADGHTHKHETCDGRFSQLCERSVGIFVHAVRHTHRHETCDSRFSQFCERSVGIFVISH